MTEQHLLHALRWQPGRRLGIQVYNGLLVVGSADDGRHRVGSRGALPLPASARRMCGIEPGQPVLLAALVTSDLLVIHSVSTLARLVADLHAQMPGGAHVC
ncbi:AbrB/MazE/SpoVT family DNA-binding domain-containing protein [Micromonospora sp. NBC_00898]|uniref:AbrB/MazE/SpoVT family DNA-binding domain-containing protein n=1 Tax=Micromonospora sp. NBC_00898 TaxID=2975981 RepID=UPI00386F15AD|nr:AbrB/MazE/SpoVT family DNA-binding domain-containing protein [Micromonospora sp. NBC_00898]